MRKRMFSALVVSGLVVVIGGSTKYAVAWRDGAATVSGQRYQRTFTSAPLGLAQHAGHQTSGQELPVVVDGAKTPGRIPDWMAYRHFISLNSLPSDALAGERSRRDVRLERMGLAPRDREALVRVLGGTRETLDDIAQRRAQWTDNSQAAESWRHQLRLEEQQVFDAARQDVLGALSPDGANRLARHIQNMKKSIVIRGTMPQF